MRTVVGLTTFSLPGILGAAPAAGASAMIPPYLVSWLSFRRRRRGAGVVPAVRATGHGLELLLVAAWARVEFALRPHAEIDDETDDVREDQQDDPQDGVLVSPRLGVLV